MPDHRSCFVAVFQRAFEHLERAVVFVLHKVLHLLFELSAQLVAVIVFADLKLHIFVAIIYLLESPLVFYLPAVGDAPNYHWFIGLLESFDEILHGYSLCVHTLNFIRAVA